jgi:HSP20 family molecular chaperone IbpA
MIRDIGESVGEAVFETVGRAVSRVQENRPVPADLLESDDAYLVVFDAPGARADDVQVRFEDGTVHVRIDRFREFYDGFEMQFPGRGLTLEGHVDLPDGAAVRAAEASAELTDEGTLHVHVPKAHDGDGSPDETTAAESEGSAGTAGEPVDSGESTDNSAEETDDPAE